METKPPSTTPFQYQTSQVNDEKPDTAKFEGRHVAEKVALEPYVSSISEGGLTDKKTGTNPKRLMRKNGIRKVSITNQKHLDLIKKCEASLSAISIINTVKEHFGDVKNEIDKLEKNLGEAGEQIREMKNDDKNGRIPVIKNQIAFFEKQVRELTVGALEAMAGLMVYSEEPPGHRKADFLALFSLLDTIDPDSLKTLCHWEGIPESLVPVLNGKLLKNSLKEFIEKREPGLFRTVGSHADVKELQKHFDNKILISCQCGDRQQILGDAMVLASFVKALFRERFQLSGVEKELLDDKLRELNPTDQMLLVDLLDIICLQCCVSATSSMEEKSETLTLTNLAIAIGPSLFCSAANPGESLGQFQARLRLTDYFGHLTGFMDSWQSSRQSWLQKNESSRI